jgi:hypothetical protein
VTDPETTLTPQELDEPLTPRERRELRSLLLAHQHASWFWQSLGIGLKWAGIAAVGVVAAKTLLGDFRDLVKVFLR